MNELLKQAFIIGQQLAAKEMADRLQHEIKKRSALVGWKEQSVAPSKLSEKPK